MNLVSGISSLFGLRTDIQFGKLKLQTVVSQKKSASASATSKGGKQTTPFEFSATNYEENRHFFLSHFFRERYDDNMKTLPTISSGITIKRIEIWVTNKSATTENNRNIIALADLGEPSYISNHLWNATGNVPANRTNTEYETIVNNYPEARDISQTTAILDGIGGGDEFEGSRDYEKLQSARKLNTNEYTLNAALGYINLSNNLQTDDVLAVAYEYTYNGATFQVGEFASDITDNSQALIVKLLKSTTGNPKFPTWKLMMKNVYNLGGSTTQGVTSVQKENFRLDVKYLSDSTGVYLSYLPNERLKSTPIIKALNADRLDDKNNAHSNGFFDYVEGYTILKGGRVVFPVAEPFGSHLRNWIADDELADKFCFQELYDSTKTVAKQIAEHDKFLITGKFKGNIAGEIDLGVTNVAPGSVRVTAGGVTLTENTYYTVDYNMGRVTIINQSIIDAKTDIQASVESNDTYGMQRKTMLGFNADYEFNKNLTVGGTLMFLNEQPLTTKVNMGSEPLKNTLWGAHISWKKESQWLTNMIDKLPLIQCTQPSLITFNGEFAQLVAGQNHSVQGRASYLDDFEQSSIKNSLTQPTYWTICSTPSMFPESKLSNYLIYGYNRALLAWYYVDPIFTRRSSTLTPSHIKSDLDQLSNHYVREVHERELYPLKAQNSYNSASSLNVLNLAYYPNERGAYNLTTEIDQDGHLLNPQSKWGGMMRKIDNTDFEAQNIQYIEFWMMDPFIYNTTGNNRGGDFYINLGEVSEDILKDGKKFFESGMPVDGSSQYYTEELWGHIPNTTSVTYAFNNESGSRIRQDVGLNGLNDEEERQYETYQQYLQQIQHIVRPEVYDSIFADPANDNYHYYRGTDFDQLKTSILDRYKRINMPQGNSADSDTSPESYETSWKSTPDIEDINQDFTLNEYEKYYQYHISIRPEDMVVGRNHIADMRTASVKLRNGNTEDCKWYLFRVPLSAYESKEGNINDFTSIRFMRMFLTNFQQDVIIRLATLDMVQGNWRPYERPLYTGQAPSSNGTLEVSNVSIEENSDKKPVNYVLPPGISRITDPSQSQLVENNEQAMCLITRNLSPGDARAVYKNCTYNMRQYKHLQLYLHANALAENITETTDGECSVFLRLGSDYKSNYYEYEIPLTLTPERFPLYDPYSPNDCRAVWPAENMLDIDLTKFTSLKKNRNREKSLGNASFNQEFSDFDSDRPSNRITVMGNPTLGEVKTIMIGVRNNGRTVKSVEVWANELRLQEFSNEGGWAAQAALNIQLSDLGSVNVQGHYEKAGFGGIEQSVSERSDDNTFDYTITTQMDLGKLLPPKAKVNMPLYYSYARETIKPKYNPLDTDMLLSDALDAATTQHEKDSITSLTTQKQVTKNLSLSGVKVNVQSRKHPMPYDPANFTFNYNHTHTYNTGETTVYEHEKTWRGGLNYSWTPNWKTWEPFKKIKSKSKWLDLVKAQNLNFAPQSITFSTDIVRNYYEIQERDMDNLESPTAIPVRWTPSFLWNREFNLRWDLTKALHFTFQSGTHAEIEEPYTPVNKDLYADNYSAWKDSVMHSIRGFGTPLDYSQSSQLSYKVPLDKIPATDWIAVDGSYQGTYAWKRGAELEDGSTLGNTVNTQRTINLNGKLNMETLYNHSAFLKDANKRFSTSTIKSEGKKKDQEKKKEQEAKKKEEEAKKKALADAQKKAAAGDSTALKALNDPTKTQTNAKGTSAQKKQVKGFAGEVVVPDSAVDLKHGQKSKRIIVTAKDEKGKPYDIRYKLVDENTIKIQPSKDLIAAAKKAKKEKEKALKAAEKEVAKRRQVFRDSLLAATPDSLVHDSATLASIESLTLASVTIPDSILSAGTADSAAVLEPLKLRVNVVAKPKLEDEKWYQWTQAGARFLMMLRNVSVSFRNTYALALPGFMPNVGDMLGQRKLSGVMSPGLDFAFGLVGDDYIETAKERNWLLSRDSVATPATTNAMEDVQIKASLEPLPDLKIDLNASRTVNRAKSIQYMFIGNPTTQTGSFNMTTISLRTAFQSKGNAGNGYDSKAFRRFQEYLPLIQQRVESRYLGTKYPEATGMSGTFNPENGTVDPYGSDVMIPAFLAAYTGKRAASTPLDIFPSLSRILPNWNLTYKGLSNLPWVRDHLKSVTLTHGYKSIYAVGSYNTYSSWIQYMGGNDMGYTMNATTGLFAPSSMYDISTVSINEAFSPLAGLNVTLQNNMTLKFEYRKTRVLTLSMTSAQINEASSADVVFGWGYKIDDFKIAQLFSKKSSSQRASDKNRKNSARNAANDNAETTNNNRNQNNRNSGRSNFAHSLNLRFDFSFRNQDAITRNIQTSLSEATSGNRAIKTSFAADYAMSRYVTFSLYYDRQRNDPLLSTSSYPTITQDFGFNLKFTLTR
jgi:cell surface protein SprA